MRIVIGSIQCEGNSLTPIHTRYDDFDYAAGEAMFEKLQVVDYFKEQDCDIIPTIYAHALPGGAVVKADYLRLVDELVEAIPEANIDGIWLYLHGSMCVEEIGSGEEYLLEKVRTKVGFDIPISLALDFHANNSDRLVELVNYITGFRTAPHCDHADTQIRAARALVHCIESNILPRPQIARADVVICGDMVQTALEPLRSIMLAAEELEKITPGVLGVQVFNGQPWIDEAYMGPNFVVTHESDTEIAMELAHRLAKMYYDARYDFKFLVEAVTPEEAVALAMQAEEDQVFISDSGDNTTAGAAGDNAYMLNLLQKAGATEVLLAGIADEEACEKCYAANLGDTLTLKVGGSLDKNSEQCTITGRLIHRGDILSYTKGNAGPCATLDCGKMTVVVTKNRAALCRPDVFESINLDYRKYKIVVVKLGYLFPELAAVAPRAILAFTPGTSTERLEDMHMKRIRRPMYPLDDNFM